MMTSAHGRLAERMHALSRVLYVTRSRLHPHLLQFHNSAHSKQTQSNGLRH